MSKQKAFTLIELLVVIAIIGLLSSVVFVSLSGARASARDAKRIAEINQIQKALEMYYNTYGSYLGSNAGCGATLPNNSWCNSVESMSSGHWLRDGSKTLAEYFSRDPIDPKQGTTPNWTPVGGGTYFYFSCCYGGHGEWYMIVFGLENTNHPLQNQDGVTACDGTYFHYGSGSDGVITVGGNCRK